MTIEGSGRHVKATDYAPPGPLDLAPPGPFVPRQQRLDAILDALAGVELGEFDLRILDWVSTADNDACRTLVSLFLRARNAGGGR